MKLLKRIASTSLMLLLSIGLMACSDNKAENAGEKVDEVMQDAGNAVEDACEDVKESVDDKYPAEVKDPDC
jgi:predicted small secreted protein